MSHVLRGINHYTSRRALWAGLLLAALWLGLRPGVARAQTPIVTDTTFLPLQPFPLSDQPIYLPLISGELLATATPAATAPPPPATQTLSGLIGTLEQAAQPQDTETLRMPSGARYILVPATAALARTTALLAAGAPLSVKVWGTLYMDSGAGSGATNAYIIVTDIAAAESAPVPTRPPTPTLTSEPLVATARFDVVNLYTGPGTVYARGGQITMGMRCPISGRNANAAWIRIDCPVASGGSTSGWIEPRFVNIIGRVNDAPIVQATQPTPTPTPTSPATPSPAPTATAYAFRGWRTLYFTNAQLRGAPAFVDDLMGINANWGAGSPRAAMPADYFSIVYERTVRFAPDFYFFTADADDGIRFLLDDVIMLDQWNDTGAQTFRLGMPLSGPHDLRVEYNEVSGNARVRFTWGEAAQPARWQADYVGLPNMPTGVMARQEPDGRAYQLDYNWGTGSPTGAPADNWTGRWVGRFRFEDGNYVFQAQGQDGIRVTLDGTVVINKWNDGYGDMRNRFIGVGAGDHTVQVDYYDRQGPAAVRVWWYRDTTPIAQ